MAKIFLIRTRIEKSLHTYSATPPLGLMYLASVLRKKGLHDVKILNMRLGLLVPADVVREFSAFKPDIVGISSFTQEVNVLHQVARAIKQERRNCPIIVGGAHANACPEDVLIDPNIDYLVSGEGEHALPELIEAITSDKPLLSDVKGIAFRDNSKIVKTSPREYIQNLDEIPFPSWDLIDLERHFMLPRYIPFIPPDGATPYMSIMTSRGCPFSCIYCHNVMGKRFRARSPENVFSEIKTLYRDYNIREFEIIDDCFNFNKKRVINICDFIIDSGMKIKLLFPNGLRGDLLDEELLQKLHRAGTTFMSFAPETGSPRLQKVIKKSVNLKKLDKVISEASDLGIHTHGFFMLGFPTETKKDMDETLQFASKTKLHTASFFIVNPFPNTELYKMAKAIEKKVDFKFNNISYHDASFNLSEVSTRELLAYQRKGFITFFLNPQRIFRILKSSAVKKKHLLYYIGMFIRRTIFRKS